MCSKVKVEIPNMAISGFEAADRSKYRAGKAGAEFELLVINKGAVALEAL
jgi:hypothetical protein